MSTHIKILGQKEITRFDMPPEFNGEERKKYFTLPSWVKVIINSFRTPTNKVGFILQFGYFKAVNKFFIARNFHEKDIDYITRKLNLNSDDISLNAYIERTYIRHQELILDKLGFYKFSDEVKATLMEESFRLASNQMRPRFMFFSLVDFLQMKRIQIPGFHTFAEIITDTLKTFEKNLLALIESTIRPDEKLLLDKLLEFSDEYFLDKKEDLKIKRYKLTLLKKKSHSIKPSRIKENVKDLRLIHSIYNELHPIINRLNLSPEIIRYYARTVIKSQIFQIKRRENDKKYLLLIAFVVHHYYELNDILAEILLKAVQTTINTSIREHKEKIYEKRQSRGQVISTLIKAYNDKDEILVSIKNIAYNPKTASEEKLAKIIAILDIISDGNDINFHDQLSLFDKESQQMFKDGGYFEILADKSIKLQNRVSNIIKEMVFDSTPSDKAIIEAIQYYKVKDGHIGKDAPVEFLDKEQLDMIYDESGKLRTSLYKALLFIKAASALKSGALNLIYSYQFKTFDKYLIPLDLWQQQKENILDETGLNDFKDIELLEKDLKEVLGYQYRITNDNIQKEVNKYAKIYNDGSLKVTTPKVDKEEVTTDIDLFPKNKFIPLFEVLSTINRATNFVDSFEHWKIKHNREKPDYKTFYAGLIGYGCNLGIRKTAKISKNINQNELENTVNWYFNSDNIKRANDRIIEFINKMRLTEIFKKDENKTHTSSDGQKYNIAVDSVHANHSYKYFGKGKGVSVYSFIDESHKLFYSSVISSSAREASYVIDGLMHNDIVKSDIHSTDTHGYNEMIFGVTHLLGISFAPRIKKFQEQTLYGFESKSNMRKENYQVLPDKKIDVKTIRNHWDDILRFIATIKMKHTTASQLFKRLSSYSKQHPLYRALKEFGKIIKSIFLLRYIDDLELRQIIEKQMNKLESTNKFRKAVFHGNNQEFQQAGKEEQLIADGCSRLIQNAIICWNYLYLSQMICDTSSSAQKQIILQNIKNKSVVAWGHINLLGEYDFNEKSLSDLHVFSIPRILDLQVA